MIEQDTLPITIIKALQGSNHKIFTVGIKHIRDTKKTIVALHRVMKKAKMPLRCMYVRGDINRPVLVDFNRTALITGNDQSKQRKALVELTQHFQCIYAGRKLIASSFWAGPEVE